MKARIALVSALIIPAVLFLGCASQAAPEPMPPLNPPSHPPVMIEVSCDDFAANQHMTRDVEINLRASIVLSLCSNASTGYQWNADAEIGDTSVISQYEHNFVAPQSEQNGQDQMLVGAPGKDVYTFQTLATGTTTITLHYSRAWETNGDTWTYTMNVTVID
jgi:inhibitor of cysteine peptidase